MAPIKVGSSKEQEQKNEDQKAVMSMIEAMSSRMGRSHIESPHRSPAMAMMNVTHMSVHGRASTDFSSLPPIDESALARLIVTSRHVTHLSAIHAALNGVWRAGETQQIIVVTRDKFGNQMESFGVADDIRHFLSSASLQAQPGSTSTLIRPGLCHSCHTNTRCVGL